MPTRNVLILGGGVGGVVAATRIRKRFPDSRVVLVDRERDHLFQPSLLWLATGSREPERIRRPLNGLRRLGVEVINGEITELSPNERRIRVNGSDITADAMVISLGADLAPERVPGLADAGHNLYTLAGATAIRDALRSFGSGRVVVLTAAPAYKCPAAPYEAAMLVRDYLCRNGRGGAATVEIHAAEPGPMATAGPEVSAAVRGMVEAQGIVYHPSHQVETVDPDARKLRFADGTTAGFDLLIYVPPHRAPAVLGPTGLLAENGWISVNAETLATNVPEVFAIGDATAIPIPSGKVLPKAGVFAHQQAEVVADNITALWAGRAPHRVFDGKGACFIETGRGRAGYGSGDFYAAPVPAMRLHRPARWWHWGKVMFERRWLGRWP
jgi:sulfide:quinone oxidoreductase